MKPIVRFWFYIRQKYLGIGREEYTEEERNGRGLYANVDGFGTGS
jgi:hypothetical protein